MRKIITTFIFSVLGGTIFYLLHLPLPWTLGPMTATILRSERFGKKAYWPVSIRNTGLIVLGYTMGSPFTLDAGKQIVIQLPSMVLATFTTIMFGMLMGYLTYRRTGISLASCMLGSIPGGLTQMAVLSGEIKNTNVAIVTFMQTIRMLTVVFSVPFIAIHGMFGSTPADASAPLTAAIALADNPFTSGIFIATAILGAFIAARIKFPTPFMLGPVIATIILVLAGFTPPTLPRPLINLAQIMVGTFMGKDINLDSIKECPTLLPYTLGSSVGLVVFSLLLGVGLSSVHTFSLVSAFLGTAPGGIAEMGITALTVNADISIVIAYQLFRLLTILLIVPIFLKWRLNR